MCRPVGLSPWLPDLAPPHKGICPKAAAMGYQPFARVGQREGTWMGAGVLSMAARLVDSSSFSLSLRLPVPHWREFKSAHHHTQLARGMCYGVTQTLTHVLCYYHYPTITLRDVLPFTSLLCEQRNRNLEILCGHSEPGPESFSSESRIPILMILWSLSPCRSRRERLSQFILPYLF